ncbi:uncharacterized protein LOC100827972 [Brachypodium distachyon]|nr:uncharacterized protein LOC100827972 [Brachypodium distachyon]|eukprot:XP_003565640.1 uncharacterized protein LOC100827972 [Brachypodium distachyon]
MLEELKKMAGEVQNLRDENDRLRDELINKEKQLAETRILLVDREQQLAETQTLLVDETRKEKETSRTVILIHRPAFDNSKHVFRLVLFTCHGLNLLESIHVLFLRTSMISHVK